MPLNRIIAFPFDSPSRIQIKIFPDLFRVFVLAITAETQAQPAQNENGQVVENLPAFLTLVPKAGLEPARSYPPPPQDGVSTRFHHFGTGNSIIW
jgi:hypothetical protein